MKPVRISIVIPCYNAETFLHQTLASIDEQISAPYEVLLINDGSQDRSAEIFKSWASDLDHPFIATYHHLTQNRGIGYARNSGLFNATGDYVAFLSADDTYDPWFISLAMATIKKHPDCGTFTDYYRCDEFLRPFQIFMAPEFKVTHVIQWALQKDMFINFSSVIFPKDWFVHVHFQEDLRHGEDLIFLLDSILAGCQWQHIGDPLVYYRTHPKQGTRLIRRDIKEWQDLWMHLIPRLKALGVDRKRLIRAYHQNYKKIYASPLTRILRKARTILRS